MFFQYNTLETVRKYEIIEIISSLFIIKILSEQLRQVIERLTIGRNAKAVTGSGTFWMECSAM